MNTENIKLAILGSTGSVGKQSVEVALNLGARVELLMAHSNIDELERQARLLKPKICVITDENRANELRLRLNDTSINVYSGEKSAIEAICECDADVGVNAVSGFAGLYPALALAKSGKRIAMSNKEAIVVAYKFLLDEIRKGGSELIPVDSEHSAIFQCLQGRAGNNIKKIILTSSGGPFRGKTRNELLKITASDALSHPTWKMGAKITIDSASLMNKGFEVIEAVRLFGVSPDQVQVVVHPQSIMHSAVEYIDNSVIAQMGAPDMRTCIQYAITYPQRREPLAKALDFASIGALTFENPDMNTFSLLSLAFYAIEEDGILPSALNASDEVAVDAFLKGKIGFVDVFDIVSKVVYGFENIKNPSLEDIYNADREARIKTLEQINSFLK
ncbi:MAG: 1-deoxy-D-xylulose-5-phosphate reductoisomerase [Clostridia bacterium]|nr:1-deoxy-D-xylulose-5-phosphate reductoisomerase [Clostridia bacterium]